MQNSKIKTILVVSLVVLAGLIIAGLTWFWTAGGNSQVGGGWYLFSFATGLTMIVLPCTLPLAFVIVPLSMNKGPVKGLGIALSFGLGVTLMLSLYGVFAAAIGKTAIGSLGAPLEVVKNWMYVFAGAFAYLFALSEIGIINFRMPTYTGSAPAFIQKQGDFIKAFLLGIFLGNVGVGCPHPATPVILTRIATSGSIFYGWLLFLVHAVGRILPLLMLAILAILGVNALNWLVSRKDKIEKATGWGMVFVAGFILVLGLFTHDWWVHSGQHTLIESITQEERFLNAVGAKIGSGNAHAHGLPTGRGLFGLPLALGNWVLVFLWVLPMWLWYKKKKTSVNAMAESEEKHIEQKELPLRKWMLLILAILIIFVFAYTLPQRFYYQSTLSAMNHSSTGMSMQGGMAGMAHGSNASHNTATVTSGVVSEMQMPEKIYAGKTVRLMFKVSDKTLNKPVAISSLTVEHDKLMHVLGLRNDMNEFLHIHPQILDDAGGVMVVDYIFAKPGVYKIWSELKKDGVTHTFAQKEITVLGEGAVSEKSVNYSRSIISGQYQVAFVVKEPLEAGKTSDFAFEIHNADGSETALEQYLAADMHANIIKDDLSSLIHTHPVSSTQPRALLQFIKQAYAAPGHAMTPTSINHGVVFQAVFPTPGLYRIYGQFRPKNSNLPKDEALLASFWVEVKNPPAFIPPNMWIMTGISLILIWFLCKAVKKYLTVKAEEIK